MCMGGKGFARLLPELVGLRVQVRCISGSACWLSGHNRWSKIKHDKGANDKLKSRERTLLSHAVFLASKYGGPDPNFNSRLAIAITNAKRGQLNKTSIESAIAKGQGKSVSGAPLESLTVEAILPHGVAAIIEYQTESKLKVLQDIRALIGKRGGTVTPTSFLFERKGKVWFQEQDGIGVDEAMDQAIEAGATDITLEDGKLVVDTEPADVVVVAEQLQANLKLQLERSDIVFEPKEETMVSLESAQATELSSLLEAMEDEPSLQNIYVNAEI